MNLDLARWQFAIVTVYHFLFVPLTIGLSVLVAGIQTAWVRTGKERYLRATRDVKNDGHLDGGARQRK